MQFITYARIQTLTALLIIKLQKIARLMSSLSNQVWSGTLRDTVNKCSSNRQEEVR